MKQITKANSHIRSYSLRRGRISSSSQEKFAASGSEYVLRSISEARIWLQSYSKIVVEIGFGNGHNLLARAAKALPAQIQNTELVAQELAANIEGPNVGFLGIETYHSGVVKLANQLALGFADSNLRLLQEDAVLVLQDYLPKASVSEFNIFFPDPWPKERHKKRRLIRPQVAELLYDKLKSGGEIRLATDDADYAQQMLQVFSQLPGLSNLAPAGCEFTPRYSARIITKYEQKALDQHRVIWDLGFKKF